VENDGKIDRRGDQADALDDISPDVSLRSTTYGALLRPIHVPGWARVRWGAYAVYVSLLMWIVATNGVPTGRTSLAVIIMTGLALTGIGHHWRHTAQVVIDWLPFTAVLLLYDRTRGVADHLGLSLHESDVLHAEKLVFGGSEPTVWLQHHLYNPSHVYWYDALFTLIYTSHFLATPILAAVLWLRDRALWVRYISRVVVLAFVGLVTYCLFPEAPPWMAAHDGLTDPVARLSARGWIWLHAGNLDHVLANAQNAGSNPVAAMPSLHEAFAVLVALTIGARLRSRWRYVLALYPVAMGVTLVYTGEHYVLDVLAGVAYALAVHAAVSWWEARRAYQRTAAELGAPLDEREFRERAAMH
jgi:membrane-associated phospholipid phosphatase